MSDPLQDAIIDALSNHPPCTSFVLRKLLPPHIRPTSTDAVHERCNFMAQKGLLRAKPFAETCLHDDIEWSLR